MTETQAAPEQQDTNQGKRSVRGAVARTNQDPAPIALARRYSGQISEVLPEHIETKGFLGQAFAALRKNSALMEAATNAPGAFMDALMEAATLGHVPGSKEYYLTARRSKEHSGKPVIVGIEGYRGVIERMYRSGAVGSVVVREVCKGDSFRFIEGEDEVPVHEIDWFGDVDRKDPDNIVGVYAYARLTTGVASRVVVLSKADIEDAKQRSDAGRRDAGPWHTDYRAMAWKTAAHRLEPWVPTSAEYRREQLRAASAAAAVPRNVDGSTGEVLDGDVVDAELVGGDES